VSYLCVKLNSSEWEKKHSWQVGECYCWRVWPIWKGL